MKKSDRVLEVLLLQEKMIRTGEEYHKKLEAFSAVGKKTLEGDEMARLECLYKEATDAAKLHYQKLRAFSSANEKLLAFLK